MSRPKQHHGPRRALQLAKMIQSQRQPKQPRITHEDILARMLLLKK